LQNDINLHTDTQIATLNLQELKFAIESLRPHHTGYGRALYWNPVSGDDNADGLTPQTACKTFAHIHNNIAEDYGHDIVYCIPESQGTGITSAEGIVISKNYLFVSGGSGVIITGKGIELHGVRVKTDALSSADAIIISGDFAYIDDVWIEQCGGDGISISTSSNTIVEGCRIRNCAGHGINVGNSISNLWVTGTDISNSSSSAVYINGTNVFDVKLLGECSLTDNARYGVELGAINGTLSLSNSSVVEDNTLGDILDVSSKVVYEGRLTVENSIAPSVLTASHVSPIHANVQTINDAEVIGDGTDGNDWRGVGVQPQ
jgi:hypothetical protein